MTEARVPAAFVDAFTRVEAAAADITFPADDVRMAIARRPERDATKARMRGCCSTRGLRAGVVTRRVRAGDP
ncbi:MAG: hypothetical protein R2708_02695 [Vicinamibacterales bacterium]